jgi:hypothetical protein
MEKIKAVYSSKIQKLIDSSESEFESYSRHLLNKLSLRFQSGEISVGVASDMFQNDPQRVALGNSLLQIRMVAVPAYIIKKDS